MSFNMKRTAILTALLLVGSAFVFAGSASADHAYESQDVVECSGIVSVFPAGVAYVSVFNECVRDYQNGEPSDCPEDSYNGETSLKGWGIWAGGGTLVVWNDAMVNPQFDGQEDCDSSGYEASVDALHWQSGTTASASHSWDQESIDVATSADGETLYLAWGGGDDCVTIVTVNGDPVVDEGCPAGNSPGAPNPGWGHLTPASP